MSHGHGHPPQWDYQLPRVNDLLVPTPPTTRAGTASPHLPPPYKDPDVPHYAESRNLAQYRSPWAGEHIPQIRQQDRLLTPSTIIHPLSHQSHDRDQTNHGAVTGHRISYPLHSYTHLPIQKGEPGLIRSTYPSSGRGTNFALNQESGLRPTHLPYSQPQPGGVSPMAPIEQSTPPMPVIGMILDSPWGLTKAGKARKRLEQACVNCRKKKTKCEPMNSGSKCLPCEKNNSECHFDSAARTRRHTRPAYSSSTISPAPPVSILERHGPSSSRREQGSAATSISMSSSRSSMDIGNLLSPPSPTEGASQEELERSPTQKRPRYGRTLPNITQKEASNALQHEEPGSLPRPNLNHSWAVNTLNSDVDPFEAMPEMTEHYLHHYFMNINMTTYCMFPRDKFMEWVRRNRKKTQAKKILLYAMLALGTIFSNKTTKIRNSDRRIFEKIVYGAIGKSDEKFTLHMVQTRLILGLLNYALGNGFRAWDYCGMAIRAACGMKLNVEKGLQDIGNDDSTDFDIDKPTLIECRRRTFWSAYIMDRYCGFCSGHVGLLENGNCLLRLPCDEGAYARGEIPRTPFFHTPIIDPKLSLESDRSGLGMMAYYVEISSIWGDVLAQAYQSQYQSAEQYGDQAEDFYQEQMARLEAWKAGLAPHLQPHQDNIDKAFQGGYIGILVSLWLLYHCTAMKLCRHIRFHYMKPEHIHRNITIARDHAYEMLNIMVSLAKANRERRMPESAFIVSTPFTGYGILIAVDILTAAGSLAELPALLELLSSGSEVMEEVAQYWWSARQQWKMVAERFQSLLSTIYVEGAMSGKTAFYAKKPMEVVFGLEHDLIYDVPLVERMRIIGLKDIGYSGEELIEIKAQKQATIADMHWCSSVMGVGTAE